MNAEIITHPNLATCWRLGILLTVWVGLGWSSAARAAGPSAEEYLLSGKLAAGETALLAELKSNPENDEARFGLGVIQFARALEHLLQELHQHGFLTQRTFGPIMTPELRELFPDHTNPKPFSNDVFRRMVQNWVADVVGAEKTLAKISDPNVKLRLRPALIQIDPVGQGMPVSAAKLLALMFPGQDHEHIASFGLNFDRGDVHWLRGYLHFQAAVGEGLLAHDFRTMFEVSAHRLFENVATPHTWLLEEDRKMPIGFGAEGSILPILDGLAAMTQCLVIDVVEPDRFKAALNHLEGTIANGQRMWDHILAETDDDHEWIPNPRQKGSIGIAVNQAMIDTWLDTLKEAERILEGKKLVPFWRDYLDQGRLGVRGVNIRRIFEDPPKESSIILWIQGTAASPYLQRGELTEFADDRFLERISRVFGSNFFGFAAWFN